MTDMLRTLTLLLVLPSAFAAAPTAPLPACTYKDRPTALSSPDDWPYTLLDTLYKLPPSYAPDDLIPVTEAGVGTDAMKIRELVLPDLQALLAEAEAAGVALEVQSAYRSYEYQASTFASWVAQDGLEAALRSSARPGHSEHQLGTALDFRSADGPTAWDLPDWGATPEGAWLADNAPRFGFVMSYPPGQEAVTCYIYEPWHFRYLGREVAAEVTESGLTLREWLWLRQP